MTISSETKIASVKIDGKYFGLSMGETTIGEIKVVIDVENKSDGLYSWIVYLKNNSDTVSPRISEFYGLDYHFDVQGNATLNTLRGDDCTIHAFYPETFALEDNSVVVRKPLGARSSNTSAFPYFDILDDNQDGLVCGIGWSGQWKLDVSRKGNTIRMCAGQEDCDFVLLPHEEVRSIRPLLYLSNADLNTIRQQFVKLHRKYYSPIPKITPDTYFPIASQCFDRYYWGSDVQEGKVPYFETEEAQMKICKKQDECKHFNTHWIDACWFEGTYRAGVGNYRYGQGFKNGLKPISDELHRNGRKFVLWFEPVRAHEGTDIWERFASDPTKIITIPNDGTGYGLVNLGDPEVWQYQFEHICNIIEESGVDVYRQDFNLDPLDYLKRIETPDRVGIAQIKFVEGLYKLWDALLAKFPHLMIDDCASGGRLIDVETMMRAIPLWQSDMACRPTPAAMQNETLCLSRYLPYHQAATFDEHPYFLRSTMTTGVACQFDFLVGEVPPETVPNSLKILVEERFVCSTLLNCGKFNTKYVSDALEDVIRLKEYWEGDFTALTEPSITRDAIIAYNLYLPEEDRGVVVVLRREEAPDKFTIKLPTIHADKKYKVTLCDDDFVETEQIISGDVLFNGYEVTIKDAPGSLLVFYQSV